MKKKISPKIVSLIFAVLIVCFAIAFYAIGWTEPGSPPPICPSGEPGCDAPVNIGGTTQYKSGALGIGGLFQTDNETHLAILGGNVGIGTTSPSMGSDGTQLKLDVDGNVGAKKYCDEYGDNCKTVTEAFGGTVWESDWYYLSRQKNYSNGSLDGKGTVMDLTHNLGSYSVITQILLAPDSGGSPNLAYITTMDKYSYSYGDEGGGKGWDGITLHHINNTDFKIRTGEPSMGEYINDAGSRVFVYSGWVKIILMK